MMPGRLWLISRLKIGFSTASGARSANGVDLMALT
jgi:hypothetical protein